jgi:hypothetical protein
MTFLTRGRVGLTALVTIVVGLAAGSIAYATIPDSSGVIHGCYTNTGALRVIDTDAGATCRANETALEWNQTGPPGLSGYEQVIGTWAGGTDTVKTAVASCGSGKKVLGGGYTLAGNNLNVFVWTNGPSSESSWAVQATKNPADGTNWTLVPYALCATVAS